MSRRNIIIAVCAVIAVILAVVMVMPDREEKARTRLDAAYEVEQSGQFDRAVALYEQLVAEYPGTAAARSAGESIERVMKHKFRVDIIETRRSLDRVALVINGYREMLGVMPTSLQQLDEGEYMFDSGYIADIPPEGFTYYLRFEPETSSYTLFSVRAADDQIIRYDGTGKTDIISRERLTEETSEEKWQQTVKGRVVFLQPAT